VRVQADDAGLEIDVAPLHRWHFARDTPSGDVRELHSRTDCQRQVSEDAIDLLPLEEARSHVSFLQHRDVRHVRQLPVLSRQVEDALQRSQLAVDLAVRDLPFLTSFWKLMMQLLSGETPHWSSLANANSHTHKLTMAVASTAAIRQVMAPGAPGLEAAALQKLISGSKPFVKEFNDRKLAAIYTDLDAQGNAVLPDSTVNAQLAATMCKTARSTVESMALIHPHALTLLKQLVVAARSAAGATGPVA
jgi:AbiV family abortive infection protein